MYRTPRFVPQPPSCVLLLRPVHISVPHPTLCIAPLPLYSFSDQYNRVVPGGQNAVLHHGRPAQSHGTTQQYCVAARGTAALYRRGDMR
eukprot:3431278-Rhodomonas_salina.1